MLDQDLDALKKLNSPKERAAFMLNIVAKWRSVFAGRILGTRDKEDVQCEGFRDFFEALLITRAELNAVTALLLKQKVFSQKEYQRQIEEECMTLDKLLEQKFPGFHASSFGMQMEPGKAKETMKGWKP